MKTNHQDRKSTAAGTRPSLIESRFGEPKSFGVEVRVHAKTQSAHSIQTVKNISIIALTLLTAMALVSSVVHAETKHGDKKDIVALASGAGSFKTLVAAVKPAGLVETLQGPGPFTVFAPADKAFAKLPN